MAGEWRNRIKTENFAQNSQVEIPGLPVLNIPGAVGDWLDVVVAYPKSKSLGIGYIWQVVSYRFAKYRGSR